MSFIAVHHAYKVNLSGAAKITNSPDANFNPNEWLRLSTFFVTSFILYKGKTLEGLVRFLLSNTSKPTFVST